MEVPPQGVTQRFWLLKSEPSCFSFADLQARPDGVEHWDGVRNFQARNFLRDDLKAGDGVLFYHSSIPEPAIDGVARVVREGYPDFTARDPNNEHFDPRATDAAPIWYMVDVQAVAPLPHPLTRQMLMAHPFLGSMAVLKRGNRLSVQEVTAREWREVLAAGGLNVDMSEEKFCGR
ncbi:MAG: EVE domain-containing protein [Desulfuromonadales bacterium]|nr:EVE domain-containing protein [Desulfuromonadales bacterium]